MQAMQQRLSRRQMTFILGCFGAASASAETQKHRTAIHQEVDFKATPARIYEVMLDAKQFATCTKDAAEIEPRAGAPFKLFGGRIEGRNVELVPNQRIVQAWRPSYWPAGVYSIVKFELLARNSEPASSSITRGLLNDKWAGLNEGWGSHYWEPLHKYLNA